MLEETAGTALYNEKKRESEKIIKKKEEKVNKILFQIYSQLILNMGLLKR